MKYFILFFLYVSQLQSQNYLLIKENGLLSIYNLETEFKITLDSIDHNELVGYNWKNDSLHVSLQNQGLIKINRYKIEDSIFNKLKSKKFFKVKNFKALYFHNPKNSKTIYFIDSLKIVVENGMKLSCFINEKEVWVKHIPRKAFGGIGASGFGYQNPKISNDLKRILVSYYDPKLFRKALPSILEIDVQSGIVLNTIKNSTNYSYSCDSEFILFSDNDNGIPSVFSEKDKLKTDFYTWKNFFWLFK